MMMSSAGPVAKRTEDSDSGFCEQFAASRGNTLGSESFCSLTPV